MEVGIPSHLGVVLATHTFNRGISLSCGGLPGRSSCAFTPNSMSLGDEPAEAILTISTTARAAALGIFEKPATPLGVWFYLIALLAFGAVLLTRRSSLRSRALQACLGLILFTALFQTGCGGGSSSPSSTVNPATPIGTFTVTVRAASASLVHESTVTLVVE